MYNTQRLNNSWTLYNKRGTRMVTLLISQGRRLLVNTYACMRIVCSRKWMYC